MDTSSIFDDLNTVPTEFDAFFDANIDSITNFFDLNQLDNYESTLAAKKTNLYETNHEFLFDQSNWSNGSGSMSPPSDSSSSPKSSELGLVLDNPSSNSTSDFTFLDEQQQQILELEMPKQQEEPPQQPTPPPTIATNVQPISFILPETIENGMKITNEIILNFDQMDEAKLYEQYELLSKIDLSQQLNVITMDSNETRIQLNDNDKMSDDEDDNEDEDDDSEEQTVNQTKNKNKKVKKLKGT